MKTTKQQSDEFTPCKAELEFWQIPKSLALHPDLSWGAKTLYGVLYCMAYKSARAYPGYQRIKKAMGNPSDSTINRWLKELKDLRLIRVLQKGRGLTNNYYFLRSPILGNMTESEFEEGPKSVYGGRLLDEATLVTGAEAFELFRIEAHEWLRKSRYVGQYSFPKWYGRKDRQLYKSVKQEFDMQLKEKILFSSLDTITTELEWNEHSALCSQEVGCE